MSLNHGRKRVSRLVAHSKNAPNKGSIERLHSHAHPLVAHELPLFQDHGFPLLYFFHFKGCLQPYLWMSFIFEIVFVLLFIDVLLCK